jgi:hypothetical protein
MQTQTRTAMLLNAYEPNSEFTDTISTTRMSFDPHFCALPLMTLSYQWFISHLRSFELCLKNNLVILYKHKRPRLLLVCCTKKNKTIKGLKVKLQTPGRSKESVQFRGPV